jgi:glutamate N-acetyltransferase / amino-acid N-acetyltransferase
MLLIKNIKLSAINCGLKYKNRDDLLLIQFPENTAVAGVFTKSSMAAAPVKLCQENLQSGRAQALIVNAGNANAFTGISGMEAAQRVTKKVAEILGCVDSQVFMSSTGVIGERLKDELIIAALPYLKNKLSSDETAWQNAAKSIMTTDTFQKSVSKTIKIQDKEIVINAFAKGSGMIAPNMATMLGYIFTNANICSKLMQKLLSEFNEETFNAITVDSDTSTNDTVLFFATREASNEKIRDINDPNLVEFKTALKDVMLYLAKQVVIDGEGATKLIEIEVQNAASKEAAKIIALSIANSPLVKTAIAGCDPNWGRIIMAIGKSGQEVIQEKIGIKIGNFQIVQNGEIVANYDEKPVHQYLQNKEVKISVDINLAKSQNRATVWTCDFTEGYIKINKDYRS